MGIRKQEFYEGAALHQLVRSDKVDSIRYRAPFFIINGATFVLLKYSTKARSPWGFTFTPQEQSRLREKLGSTQLHIALICGSDGVVAIDGEAFQKIIPLKGVAARVACFRDHREHYLVSGPAGVLERKISRSSWMRILDHNQEVAA